MDIVPFAQKKEKENGRDWKKRLDFSLGRVYNILCLKEAHLAQLVEHLRHMEGVGGSSPSVSTMMIRQYAESVLPFLQAGKDPKERQERGC